MPPHPDINLDSLISKMARASPVEYWVIPGALTTDQAVVTFEGGLPDPLTFPKADLASLYQQVIQDEGQVALQYSDGNRYDMGYGYEGLRKILGFRAFGEDQRSLNPDGVLLTSGAAQAISLAVNAFIDPGDVVLVEAPTWHYTLRAIAAAGGRPVGIPIDRDGMRIDILESQIAQLAKNGARPKLLYTIPNFNMPTGTVLSIERRRQLVDLTRRWGIIVVEDDAYGDLRYDGEPLPSIFSMDDTGLVLKIKSFSKVLAPALRVGWALGTPAMIAALVRSRQDLGISSITARVLAKYIGDGKLDAHIAKILGFYRSKRDAVVTGLAENCVPHISWDTPAGSFFFWLTLAKHVDPEKVPVRLAANGVACRLGTSFFPDGSGQEHIRLCFSLLPRHTIERGTALIGKALAQSLR